MWCMSPNSGGMTVAADLFYLSVCVTNTSTFLSVSLSFPLSLSTNQLTAHPGVSTCPALL